MKKLQFSPLEEPYKESSTQT
uniref:Uncharacterized protein n=1 Tax=Arundo donax TaxID=35708 RepID=A0A0A9GPE4_ARUDO